MGFHRLFNPRRGPSPSPLRRDIYQSIPADESALHSCDLTRGRPEERSRPESLALDEELALPSPFPPYSPRRVLMTPPEPLAHTDQSDVQCAARAQLLPPDLGRVEKATRAIHLLVERMSIFGFHGLKGSDEAHRGVLSRWQQFEIVAMRQRQLRFCFERLVERKRCCGTVLA
jgi:hypothetical protein